MLTNELNHIVMLSYNFLLILVLVNWFMARILTELCSRTNKRWRNLFFHQDLQIFQSVCELYMHTHT